MLNFKELRKKKNLTQREFSELIKISMRALSNYENGNTDITLKKLQEIADLLEISFFDLFVVNKQNQVSIIEEPKEVYQKENNNQLDLLLKNINLLKDQNMLQEDIILMLREKIEFLEEKFQQCVAEKKLH